MSACKAYRPGKLCANGWPMGYPASSACTGRVCMSCNRPNEILPACQDEDIDPRWLNDDGSPKHYRPSTGAASAGGES